MKINKDSDDGYALLNWRQPGASRTAGDFALRCHGTTHYDEIYTRLQVPLVPFPTFLCDVLSNIVAHFIFASLYART